jgi:hypothetical protein
MSLACVLGWWWFVGVDRGVVRETGPGRRDNGGNLAATGWLENFPPFTDGRRLRAPAERGEAAARQISSWLGATGDATGGMPQGGMPQGWLQQAPTSTGDNEAVESDCLRTL